MSDESLERLLKQTPPPDPNAKKRAINLAMAEFAAANKEAEQKVEENSEKSPQGFWAWLRLTLNHNKGRTTPMAFNKKKQLILGASTACVLLTSVALLRDKPTEPLIELTPAQPTQIEPTLNTAPQKSAALVEDKQKSDADFADEADRGNRVVYEQELEEAIAAEPAVSQDALAAVSQPKPQRLEARQKEEKKDRSMVMTNASLAKVTAAKVAPASPPLGHVTLSDAVPQPPKEYRDRFETFEQNSVKQVSQEPVSTFSIDVDTASYSFVRRQLNQGVLPQKDAVRIEEMINYFDYQYPLPNSKKEPFKPTVVVMDSPWKAGNKLIHIGIKGYDITHEQKPKTNLVFLLDVSGSMSSADKLPLVKQSMGLLLDNLNPDDTVAIAVYAGAAGTVLEPTAVKDKHKILEALNRLNAGGSTAGGAGIQLAYQLAEQHFEKDAVNRIILATDGDFNVGMTGDKAFKDLVERKRDKGIYLSILGFGQGNYQDALMQTLAQSGNGIAAYIDTLSEAQKVLVNEATSSLFPIANDVKIQVEFNPATVSEYRLIGYETRALKQEDFNNDKIDAGDIGAGHTVTAIYEITPAGSNAALVDASRYQQAVTTDAKSQELGFLKLRYKLPGEKTSKLITQAIPVNSLNLEESKGLNGLGAEVGFATAVAGFAQMLKGGQYTGNFSYDDVIALANQTKGTDEYGYRTEFVQLVRKAKIAKAM